MIKRSSFLILICIFIIGLGRCSFIKQAGLDDLQERVDGLEAANQELYAEVDRLESEIAVLKSQCMPPPSLSSVPSGISVEDQIRAIAAEENFSDPDLLIRLARCESSLNPNARGDWRRGRNGKKYPTSYGLYQIHLPAHRDVSKEEALSIEFSTRWTITQIRAGRGHIWTCWKKIKGGRRE